MSTSVGFDNNTMGMGGTDDASVPSTNITQGFIEKK